MARRHVWNAEKFLLAIRISRIPFEKGFRMRSKNNVRGVLGVLLAIVSQAGIVLSASAQSADAVTVTPAGDVGIGTDTPAARLDVLDVPMSQMGLRVSRQSGATSVIPLANGRVRLESDATMDPLAAVEFHFWTGSTHQIMGYFSNPSANGGIALAVFGNLWATGSYTGSSQRYKKNIQPVDSSINTIMALRPVAFDYDREGLVRAGIELPAESPELKHKQIGLIAEEVAERIPEVVSAGPDGLPSGIDYGKLTTVLIKAMQEQQVQIEALQSRLQRLEQSPASKGTRSDQ